jgi:hypothetical protein
MSEAIRDYMAEKITAFQLDDSLFAIAGETQDGTVKIVAESMWFHYDDCKNHKIVATKQEWDYFNRLLLRLDSEAEVDLIKTRGPWRSEQTIAAFCLMVFALVLLIGGFRRSLFGCLLFSGVASVFLVWYTRAREKESTRTEIAVTPFQSVSELLAVRRRVNNFNRKRYPRAMAGRRIRSRLVVALMWLYKAPLWLIFSPVILLWQAWPSRQWEPQIKVPQS